MRLPVLHDAAVCNSEQTMFEGFRQQMLTSDPDGLCDCAGQQQLPAGDPSATMRLFSCAFFRKVVTRHDTGMGESYMDADYEVTQHCLPDSAHSS